MKKEEILSKSRKENEGKSDERELQIFSNASKIGMAVGGILSVIIVVFARIINIPLLGLSGWAIYFSMFGSSHLYRYLKTREKLGLFQAILGISFGLACFVAMIVLGIQK